MKILNLTQHVGTEEQIKDGLIEPDAETKNKIKRLLTFDSFPSINEARHRASELAYIALQHNVSVAMIGGAPFFMDPLEEALRDVEIDPVYSFTKRVSYDTVKEDGSIEKTSKFVHEGFYSAIC